MLATKADLATLCAYSTRYALLDVLEEELRGSQHTSYHGLPLPRFSNSSLPSNSMLLPPLTREQSVQLNFSQSHLTKDRAREAVLDELVAISLARRARQRCETGHVFRCLLAAMPLRLVVVLLWRLPAPAATTTVPGGPSRQSADRAASGPPRAATNMHIMATLARSRPVLTCSARSEDCSEDLSHTYLPSTTTSISPFRHHPPCRVPCSAKVSSIIGGTPQLICSKKLEGHG